MTALPPFAVSNFISPTFINTHLLDVSNSPEIDEFHLSSYWNAQFSDFVFEKEIAVTDSSLVWIGTYKNSCERVALKITDKF
jgi:hypothetical protein